MNKESVNVKVDDRERSEAVFQALAAMDGVVVQTARLPLGDYLVDDDLLFERKTLNDFAVSLIDGRLFRQMVRLAASPLQGVLILEGRGADLRTAGVRRDALQGALVTIGLIFGIPVLRAMDGGESARLMVFAARQTGFVKAGGVHRPGCRPKRKKQRQLYLLQGLPGIGPVLAGRLLDRFGSVRGVLNASREELAAVDGIGPEAARRIDGAVSEPVPVYGPVACF